MFCSLYRADDNWHSNDMVHGECVYFLSGFNCFSLNQIGMFNYFWSSDSPSN